MKSWHVTSKSWYVTPKKFVELLKQKARKLKRAEQIPYLSALDKVAQIYGFHHWKHVTKCREETLETEMAIQSGFIVAFASHEQDLMEGNSQSPKCPFIEDGIASMLCRDQLFERFANSEDVDGDENPIGLKLRETTAPEELKELFESEFGDYMYFRYTGSRTIKTLRQALNLVDKYTFWPPRVLWFKGQCHDIFDLAELSQGKVAGKRMSDSSELTRYGFFPENSQEALNNQVVERVKSEVVETYLPSKTQRVTTSITSYHLKHVVEDLLGIYVDNGDCIQAMQDAGFKVKRLGEANHNAAFNLSKREFKALEKAAVQAVSRRQNS